MDKKDIALIILGLLLAGTVGYHFYNIIKTQAYGVGLMEGQMEATSQLIQRINTYGQIPVIYNNSVQYVPIQNICQGGGK